MIHSLTAQKQNMRAAFQDTRSQVSGAQVVSPYCITSALPKVRCTDWIDTARLRNPKTTSYFHCEIFSGPLYDPRPHTLQLVQRTRRHQPRNSRARANGGKPRRPSIGGLFAKFQLLVGHSRRGTPCAYLEILHHLITTTSTAHALLTVSIWGSSPLWTTCRCMEVPEWQGRHQTTHLVRPTACGEHILRMRIRGPVPQWTCARMTTLCRFRALPCPRAGINSVVGSK